jgi:SPP1 family predicted phage head-tail adaptor
MQAGRLRHKVDIEQLVTGSPDQTPEGEPDASWSVLYNDIWAAVEPLSGRELFAAQEHHSEVTTRIRVRYRSDITAKMRAVFNGENYNILAVIDPEMRHRELHLMCSTGLNNG